MEATHITCNPRSGKLGMLNENDNDDDDEDDDDGDDDNDDVDDNDDDDDDDLGFISTILFCFVLTL